MKDFIVYIAPIVAGFITSTVIPFLVKKVVVKYLKSKIDEVNSGKEFSEVKRELKEIKKEIREMRGKTK